MSTLHNDHNVYVLGAGFSVDRGLPLVRDFMLAVRDAHDWLTTLGRSDEASSIAKVLEYRLRAASAAYRIQLDLENIEELFSLAAASREQLTDDICKAIAATLDYRISVRASPLMTFRADASLPRPSHWMPQLEGDTAGTPPYFLVPLYEYYVQAMLGRLNGGATVGENTFITFNYDTLLEEALFALGLKFSYGFETKSINYSLSATDLGHDPHSFLKVFKLHGSVNWGRPGKRGQKLTVYKNYSELVGSKKPPIIVPPTWRKQFAGQLFDIWRGAIASIETATRLIIIGFSMPENDAHFKYLMAAGLQNNLSLREIVFVNPDAKNLQDKLDSLFGNRMARFELTGGKFENFVGQGTENHQIGYYGRPLHPSIQSFGVRRSRSA